MRFFALPFSICFLSLVSITGSPAYAQERDDELTLPFDEPLESVQPPDDSIIPQVDDVPLASEAVKSEREKRIDDFFTQLKKTRSPGAANRLASNIWSEWFRSGSASIDLLMHWSDEATKRKDFNIALDLLDQVITRQPDYAEGWNRRATLHYAMSNYNKSMADIQKVLALEPRHFGALSGMANILEQSGNKQAALDAWQRVLDVYPAMRPGQNAVIRLYDELSGDPA
ncbi:tetratricopeptide repeat protein [Ahrensia sp. 13_GOM-1096m]|uniref:tetratricopeptide repeat protein n=1 Tax=Ahrensia sp. 13_GOM-1096m TaxID=1380380 RepID=UPI00047C201C|nr:tetratricopeptide repeat protein [Ahrensia sp. 13_GOM-1096m]